LQVDTERWETAGDHGASPTSGIRYRFREGDTVWSICTADTSPGDAVLEGRDVGAGLQQFWACPVPATIEESPDVRFGAFPRDDPLLVSVLEHARDQLKVERLSLYTQKAGDLVLESFDIESMIHAASTARTSTLLPRIALDLHLARFDSVARRTWIEGHSVFLVRHDGAAQVFVTREEVGEGWVEMLAEALENLDGLMKSSTNANGNGPPGEATIGVFEGHTVVSSFPLVSGFDEICHAYLGGEFLFGMPETGTFVFFRESELEKMKRQLRESFLEATHPVSPHVYGVKDGVVRIVLAQ